MTHDRQSAKLFRVVTIANDLRQYDALLTSLDSAGFSNDRCDFSLYDNSRVDAHDPYRVCDDILANTASPYIVLCHQDVRFDTGDGYERLLDCLTDLTRRDPLWAIAGNAGWSRAFEYATRISDPHGRDVRRGVLPQQVVSLDENLLVLRTESGIRCSPALSGFHFYAADLCLNAERVGRTAYVIDFHVTHLSPGSPGSEAFLRAYGEFAAHWGQAFRFRLLLTPAAMLLLTRFGFLRTRVHPYSLGRRALRHPRLAAWMSRLLAGAEHRRRPSPC